MNSNMMYNILKYKVNLETPYKIILNGNSMYPVLKDGEFIIIQDQDNYTIGDVLVYKYRDEGILAHRLLETKNEKYYCKGDNCYRLEEINKVEIIGKVLNIPDVDSCFINMSMAVNSEFVKNNYSFEKTIKSEIYLKYKSLYLEENNQNEV